MTPTNFFALALVVFGMITSAHATPKTILFLGDSLTEGYGIAKDKAFPALIEKALRAKKYDITAINAGISGSTSAGAESRLKWQLKSKPHILFLALGANDGLRGLSTDALKQNLDKTITLAKSNGVRVILAGMKMPLNYGPYRTQYESVFSDLARKHKVAFVPFLLDGVATVSHLNLGDGIHPNEKGYEVIAQRILPVLEKELKGLP